MNRSLTIVIFAAVAILLLLLFSQGGCGNDKRINWRETYKLNTDQPYGTQIIQQLLTDYFPDHELHVLEKDLDRTFDETIDSTANYVFVGPAANLDSTEINSLLDFMLKGGRVFFSSKTIPDDLIYSIDYDFCYEDWHDYSNYYANNVQVNFTHPNLRQDSAFEFSFHQRNTPTFYRWNLIEDYFFCRKDSIDNTEYYEDEEYEDEEEYKDDKLEIIGTFEDGDVFFARCSYGKGYLYLHTIPLSLTNYHLIDTIGLHYASLVFSHLQEGDIYWDEKNRFSEFAGRRKNDSNLGGDRLDRESPLKYILSQPPLAWAWYVSLAMLFFYLIFRAKRKQNIIPVLEENKNTSLEFIKTIGQLYFIQNNHRNLCLEMMRLLLLDIRNWYHLPTNQLDAAFQTRLISKSGVDKKIIEKLFLIHKNIQDSQFATENTMVEFKQLQDQFYQQAK